MAYVAHKAQPFVVSNVVRQVVYVSTQAEVSVARAVRLAARAAVVHQGKYARVAGLESMAAPSLNMSVVHVVRTAVVGNPTLILHV